MKHERLGEIASFIRGITFKPDDVLPLGSPGTVGCMRTKNVQAELDVDDVWAVPQVLVPREEQMLRTGDILISSANSWNLVGKCSWVPKLPYASSFGGFVAVLRSTSDKLDSRFLYRWFSSTRMQALVRSFGRQTTNISNLDIQRCRDLEVPLPPLHEQRRIAAILDQADALRAKRREALAQLDNLAQSIFIEMFGDPVVNPHGFPVESLTDICHCYSGGTPSKAISHFWEGSLPWFSAKDMKSNDLFDSQDHIHENVTRTTSLKLLPRDTVAIVVRGMILAHTFPVCVLRVAATINQDLKALIPRQDIETQFLAFCLRSQSKAVLEKVSEAGHGTKRLDSEGLAQIKVLLPTATLQQTFATRIQAVESLKTTHRAALAELDALFASLQHRAFNGSL